jgi:UPF0288 family protein (methanogenesis marker protein 3)
MKSVTKTMCKRKAQNEAKTDYDNFELDSLALITYVDRNTYGRVTASHVLNMYTEQKLTISFKKNTFSQKNKSSDLPESAWGGS